MFLLVSLLVCLSLGPLLWWGGQGKKGIHWKGGRVDHVEGLSIERGLKPLAHYGY